MSFTGRVMQIPAFQPPTDFQLSHDPKELGAEAKHSARSNSQDVRRLVVAGANLEDAWRFAVLQTLDDYRSTLRFTGVHGAAKIFEQEPVFTGFDVVDAAMAALAEHLASIDGWQVEPWVLDPSRVVEDSFPLVPHFDRDTALTQSPESFRRRGIYITERSLWRA